MMEGFFPHTVAGGPAKAAVGDVSSTWGAPFLSPG